MPYFVAAEKCQKQIANIAEDGSLTARYCLVLEELRLEAVRQTSRKRATQNEANNATLSQVDFLASEHNPGSFGELGTMDFNVSPMDTMADMTSWEQFDSIVSSW